MKQNAVFSYFSVPKFYAVYDTYICHFALAIQTSGIGAINILAKVAHMASKDTDLNHCHDELIKITPRNKNGVRFLLCNRLSIRYTKKKIQYLEF